MLKRQRGVALVVGMLIMITATVVGVSSMSQSSVQERAASNQRAATNTFMAAEAGLLAAIRLLNEGKDANGSPPPGSLNGATWQTSVAGICNSKTGCIVRSVATDDATKAMRAIQIVYKSGSLAPINIIGDVGDFTGAKSNSFTVTGAPHGAAIATNSAENVDKILDGIDSSRLENYSGGIREVDFDSPFDDPALLAKFIEEVEESREALDPSMRGTITPVTGGFNFDIGTPTIPGNPPIPAVPKITVYDQLANGNRVLEMGGNVSGAGVLIVKGDLVFRGTPAFEGLVIVTGSSFKVTGGGVGGLFGGSIVFANPVETAPGEWSFGEATAQFDFDVTGGGNADFRYSADALKMAQGMLNQDAKGMWAPVNDSMKDRVKNWSEVEPSELVSAQ